MSGFRVVFALTLGLIGLFAGRASAGPVERLVQLAVHPTNPKAMVLRYENGRGGLLYSDDAGRSFRMLCTAAIDPAMQGAGTTAIAGDGRVLMGLFDGMWQDDGHGCDWRRLPAFQGRWLTDIVADPADPMVTFAITSNSGPGAANGISRRDASGQWSDLGSREDLFISSLLVANSADGTRFYESGWRNGPMPADGGAAEQALLVRASTDRGMTWRESAYKVSENNGPPRLEAVDPRNADRIVASVERNGAPDSVIVSQDRGASFVEYLKVSELGGIAFAPDGRLWIGESASTSNADASKGLWFASSLDSAPTKIADYGVECLRYQPESETLYACQAFSFGTADPSTGAFEQRFKFTTMKDFVTCGGIDMPATCKDQLCREYCGPGHFAQAGVCCAYDEPLCGPSVAESEGTGSRAMCSSGTSDGGVAGHSAAAGVGGGRVEVGGAPGSASAAGKASAEPAAPPVGGKSKQDSGCGCSTIGGERSNLWLGGSAMLSLAAGAFMRRRLRRHAVRGDSFAEVHLS